MMSNFPPSYPYFLSGPVPEAGVALQLGAVLPGDAAAEGVHRAHRQGGAADAHARHRRRRQRRLHDPDRRRRRRHLGTGGHAGRH